MGYNVMNSVGWSPDLGSRRGPKYLAIVEAMAADIEAGRLRAGDRLPPQRDLAWALKVNLSTVTQAYREASRRHLVSGEVGRGTYILAESREASLFGLKDPALPSTIDLSTNVPAIDPANRDMERTISAMMDEGGVGFAQGYHHPELVEQARIAGVDWFESRGLSLRPRDVVPCAGAQNALAAVLTNICSAGDTVLVEEYTFPGMKAVARQMGLRLHALSMDGEGVVPDALDAACRLSGARVAVLVPVLQNPTGAIMGAERRAAIAGVARRHGLTVIEDDVYGALTDVPPLACDLPEFGIVVSSLSKTVAAGLRIGWIAGHSPFVAEIAQEIHTTTWPMSPLNLEIARRWISDGTAAARTRWQRDEIAGRARIVSQGLKQRLPSFAPHVCIAVRGSGTGAADQCREAGVELVAGHLFAVGREEPAFVRMSLTACPGRRDLAVAVERLADVFEDPEPSV